jgi:hypothetical protein
MNGQMTRAGQRCAQSLSAIRTLVETDDDPCTLRCEQLDDSGSDATAASGDNCGFAMKGEGGWV